MGCVASRLEEEEEVVSICRERKKLMKLAVERRYALADAHCRYCHSLYAVSAALKLFVARHSNPCSPFLITFSPDPPTPTTEEKNVITNPMFLQQNPTQPTTNTQEALHSSCQSPVSSSSSSSSEETQKADVEKCQADGDEHEHEHEHGYDEQVEQQCGYYYNMGMQTMSMPMSMSMPSPQRDFGWDFFNPFAGELMNGGFQPNCDDHHLRAVREEEGIPELEEEGAAEFVGKQAPVHNNASASASAAGVVENSCKGSQDNVVEANGGVDVVQVQGHGGDLTTTNQEEKGLTVVDEPVGVGVGVGVGDGGRELLDALRDIEDHFVRAYDAGKEVSRMLEANKMHMQSGLEEIKENSTKLIQAITWHRSNTFRSSSASSSSCKSLLASSSSKSLASSSSKNSTTTTSWTEYKNDLFDDYGGMAAGSHSLTLGRLYAWEKKLYDEVKAGDNIRKLYEKKCAQLRNKDVKGVSTFSVDKTRASVRDLYSGILVAIRRAESISEKIQKLTDEELQPQIAELLQGLTQTWMIMLETHETQNHIIFEVKTFDCPSYGKFCNDSHRLATLQLEAEIQNWRECFMEYVAAQRSYVETLHGWLSKFIVPEVGFGSKASTRSLKPASSYRASGPPLYVICHDWLTAMENLPDKAVSVAMKSFARDVRSLWAQQGEEQDQKRKVDKMAKELEKKTLAYQKIEGRVYESGTKLLEYKKPTEQDSEGQDGSEPQTDYLSEKRDALESLKRRLELEKEKHLKYMQETQRITLNGFQTGFSLIFDAMVQFSKGSLRMYNELANSKQNQDSDNAEKQAYNEQG